MLQIIKKYQAERKRQAFLNRKLDALTNYELLTNAAKKGK